MNCCPVWEKALHHGTDCEAYGSAINSWGFGRFAICGVGDPNRFCPWCGSKKEEN